MLKNIFWLVVISFAATAIGKNINKSEANSNSNSNGSIGKLTENMYIFFNWSDKEKDFYVQGDYIILDNGQKIGSCKLSADYNNLYRFEVTHAIINPIYRKSRKIDDGSSRFRVGFSTYGKELIKDNAIFMNGENYSLQLLKGEFNGFISDPINYEAISLVYHNFLNEKFATLVQSDKNQRLDIPKTYVMGVRKLKDCLGDMDNFLKVYYRK